MSPLSVFVSVEDLYTTKLLLLHWNCVFIVLIDTTVGLVLRCPCRMSGTLSFKAGCVFAEHGRRVRGQATGATSEGSVRDGQTPGGHLPRVTSKPGVRAKVEQLFTFLKNSLNHRSDFWPYLAFSELPWCPGMWDNFKLFCIKAL